MVNHDVVLKLQEQYDCPVWVSADGMLTPIKIMSQRMLDNCYRLVTEQLAKLVSPWALPLPHGDMAADMMESALESGQADDEYSRKRSALETWDAHLKCELDRRVYLAGQGIAS